MDQLGPLASELGERTSAANRRAAEACLANPALLVQAAVALESPHAALKADAAEVMTMVAEQRPELVAPFAPALAPLLGQSYTRARWEAMHALALVAGLAPDLIAELLPRLQQIIRTDKSVIVRDYAVDAIGNYAGSAHDAAQTASPILLEALSLWDGKLAGRALNGLGKALAGAPELGPAIRSAAMPFLDHSRAVVRQAAKRLLK